MRAQWCREHIDEAAEKCGLEKSTVSDVKQAAKLCATVSEISECSTDAIIALIRIKDEQVKNHAISLVKNALNEKTPTGGTKYSKFTKPQIRKFIKKADLDIRGEMVKEIIASEPKKQDPSTCFSPQPGTIPVTDAPPIAPLAAILKEKYTIQEETSPLVNLPPLSTDADPDEVRKRDELLLQWAQGSQPPQPEFRTAAEMINGGLVTRPAPYKMAPMQKEEAEQRLIEFVRGYLTNKDREALGEIMGTGEFGHSYVEIFTGMIWFCRDQMGGE